jgi:hypothetical protein
MPLEITQREVNGIYLLALKGRLGEPGERLSPNSPSPIPLRFAL